MPGLPTPRCPLRLLQILGGAETDGQGMTGVERVVQMLIQGLDERHFAHSLAYPPTGALLQNLPGQIQAIFDTLPRRRFDWRWVEDLAGFMRSHAIDLVVTHGWRADFLTALACRRLDMPHVVARAAPLADEATLGPLRKLAYGIVDTWTLHGCAGIVTVSETSRARMCRTQGLAARRITVIPNGVEVPSLPADVRESIRARLKVEPSDLLIGAVGRLVPGKGFDVLVDAVSLLQQQHPGIKLHAVVLGEGPERVKLEERATSRGVRLLMPGFVSDPYPWMSAFDVAVLPSRAEGMPLVVLETMALGIATVATAAGGCREILADGETGFLVPVGSKTALAQVLGRLLSDSTLRKRLGGAAAREVKEKYTVEAMVQAYDAFLTETACHWYGREAERSSASDDAARS